MIIVAFAWEIGVKTNKSQTLEHQEDFQIIILCVNTITYRSELQTFQDLIEERDDLTSYSQRIYRDQRIEDIVIIKQDEQYWLKGQVRNKFWEETFSGGAVICSQDEQECPANCKKKDSLIGSIERRTRSTYKSTISLRTNQNLESAKLLSQIATLLEFTKGCQPGKDCWLVNLVRAE